MNPASLIVTHAPVAGTFSLLLPTLTGNGLLDTTGVPWIDGFTHPIDEVTHVCALVVLGMAAALLGGRSRLGLPVMFAALLTFGIVLGTQGAIPPMIDTIVMTTALALMLLVLGRVHLVFATIACVTGAFALFHGVADGLFLRGANLNTEYVAGFVLSNIILMIAGLIVGEWIHRHLMRWGEFLRHLIDRMHGLMHV